MLKVIAGNFSVRFFSAIANLLIAVIVSQFLGANGKGEQSLILATITLILLFSNLIGGASIIYLIPRLGLKNILFTSYSWTIIVSILCYVLLNTIPSLSVKHSFSIAVLSGINSLASINSSILIGKEKIQKSNVINLSIPLLTLLLITLFFYVGQKVEVESYIYALYIAYSTAFGIGIMYVISEKTDETEFKVSNFNTTFKSLFFYGVQNQLAHVFQLLNFRLSYFLVAAHSGQEAVGIYSNGISIIESIWMITSSISLYQYARISNSDDILYAKKLTENLTKMGLLLALLALTVVLLIPSSFYSWLFGKEFSELNALIRIMAPGIWIFNYALIVGHYFSGIGKYYVNVLASFVGFLTTIILSFLCFDQLDIYNAALIAVLSYFSTSLVVIIFYLKEGGKFVVFPGIQEMRLIYQRVVKSNNELTNQ